MTLSAGSHAEDNDGREAGKARKGGQDDAQGTSIEPSRGADIGIEPFLAAAAQERIDAPRANRSFHSKLLDYSAHAAVIAGLLGFAWTLSDHGAKPQDGAKPQESAAAAIPAPVDPVAELRASTQKMAADVTALRQSLEAMRGAMRQDSARQDKTSEQIRALVANLDGLKTGLNTTKAETSAAFAQMSGKIDHLQHGDPSAKLQQVIDRLDKLEHEAADPATTGSIAPAAVKSTSVALPPSRPQLAKPATMKPEASSDGTDTVKKTASAADTEAPRKPQILADWVVRDVYDGVAIVEGKRGPMEVVPGVSIPGAGVVKSIDRHGAGWTVTTSKGLLAYAPAPRQRMPRDDFYRPGPEDF